MVPTAPTSFIMLEDRFISSDNGGTTASTMTQTPTPTPTSTSTTTSSSAQTLADSVTLSGGFNPTGTITFYLFAPGVTPNANDSNNVYSDTVTVSGNGSYSTSTGTNPGGYTPTLPARTSGWLSIALTATTTPPQVAFGSETVMSDNPVDHHDAAARPSCRWARRHT